MLVRSPDHASRDSPSDFKMNGAQRGEDTCPKPHRLYATVPVSASVLKERNH